MPFHQAFFERTYTAVLYLSHLDVSRSSFPAGAGTGRFRCPLAVPAAQALHASMAGTTMSVAMGESVASMLQPFWVLPILAIAGIPMRRVMGFMVITFLVAFCCFALSLLFVLPG